MTTAAPQYQPIAAGWEVGRTDPASFDLQIGQIARRLRVSVPMLDERERQLLDDYARGASLHGEPRFRLITFRSLLAIARRSRRVEDRDAIPELIRAEIESGLADAYALFPVLKERRQQLAGTLSGGEQQMLAICRGLMAKPKLLMLDEPSWGVAPKLVTRIFETVREIRDRGLSIVLVEQNVQRALGMADYAYVIQTGRVVVQGTGSELLDNEEIRKAYLGM